MTPKRQDVSNVIRSNTPVRTSLNQRHREEEEARKVQRLLFLVKAEGDRCGH